MGIPYRSVVSPPELVEALQPMGQEITCVKGRTLLREGEPALGLYIVLDGHASLTLTTEKGDTVPVRSSGPGSLIGLPGTFLSGIYGLTATIDKDSRLVFVEREKVLDFLRRRPDICMLVLKVLGTEVSQMPNEPARVKRRMSQRSQRGKGGLRS